MHRVSYHVTCVAYKFEHSNATVIIIVMLDFSIKEALNDDGSVHSLEITMPIMINLHSCILYGYIFSIILSRLMNLTITHFEIYQELFFLFFTKVVHTLLIQFIAISLLARVNI